MAFTMTQTHESTNDQGDVRKVFRDKAQGVTVIHQSAHRGGCLYLGSVTVLNTNNAEAFTYTSTASHNEITARSAEDIAARHWEKVQ